MNAISVYRRRSAERDAVAVYDVGECIRSWGRRGIVWGGLSGFVLGAIFVANPLAADALTFGAIGTLIVCVIECAAAGGGFGALLALLSGQGVLRSDTTGLAQRRATGRRPSDQPMLPAARDHSDAMSMNPFVVFVTNNAADVKVINRPR